jgi:hypothetical protein
MDEEDGEEARKMMKKKKEKNKEGRECVHRAKGVEEGVRKRGRWTGRFQIKEEGEQQEAGQWGVVV